MGATTHSVRPRPPLRALALAAVLMLVGLVLVLMAELLDGNTALTVLGLVVVVLGVAVFAVAFWIARAMRVQVVLDEQGYVMQGRDASQSGTWAEVSRVTRGEDRITIHRADGTRVQLVVPRSRPADLDTLGADIAHRLDVDRGYGS